MAVSTGMSGMFSCSASPGSGGKSRQLAAWALRSMAVILAVAVCVEVAVAVIVGVALSVLVAVQLDVGVLVNVLVTEGTAASTASVGSGPTGTDHGPFWAA